MKISPFTFWTLVLTISPSIAICQSSSIVKEFHSSAKGSFKGKGSVNLKGSSKALSQDNRIAITEVVVSGGDLLIDFTVGKSLKREKQLVLSFHPYITFSTGELFDVHPKHLEGDARLEYSTKDRKNQLVWQDFNENFKWGNDTFDLHLHAELRGTWPVNCDKIPSFSIKQQLSHYLLGGLGAGMIITGYVLKESSEKLYDQHRDAIFFGRRAEADSNFNKSNIRNQNSAFFKVTGYSIFAANALAYLIRYLNYKSNLKAYQYYCTDQKVKLTPTLEVSPDGIQSGLQLNLRF